MDAWIVERKRYCHHNQPESHWSLPNVSHLSNHPHHRVPALLDLRLPGLAWSGRGCSSLSWVFNLLAKGSLGLPLSGSLRQLVAKLKSLFHDGTSFQLTTCSNMAVS